MEGINEDFLRFKIEDLSRIYRGFIEDGKIRRGFFEDFSKIFRGFFEDFSRI